MKISFDLDDTIIPGSKIFQTEQQTKIQKLLHTESIRIGTIGLFKELKKQNHTVGIYTTSFRSILSVKFLFLLNGFSPDFIINQKRNLRELNKSSMSCSKYPPAFNIDLHVDDSKGVEIEGQRHGFKTVIIDEHQPDWVNHVRIELLQHISSHQV
jgi:hypothetical protein